MDIEWGQQAGLGDEGVDSRRRKPVGIYFNPDTLQQMVSAIGLVVEYEQTYESFSD